MNKHEVAAVNIAAVKNQIGRTFAGAKARVVGPERNGYEVWAVVECVQCGQRQNLSVRRLGDLLKYPNEAQLWNCPQSNCKPVPAVEEPKSERDMSSAEFLKAVVLPEHEKRRALNPPAPTEEDLRRQYPAIYSAAIRTGQESKIISVEQYIASSAADRKQWDDWASAINGKLQSDYERITEGFKSVGMVNDPRFPNTLYAFARLDADSRECLLETANKFLLPR